MHCWPGNPLPGLLTLTRDTRQDPNSHVPGALCMHSTHHICLSFQSTLHSQLGSLPCGCNQIATSLRWCCIECTESLRLSCVRWYDWMEHYTTRCFRCPLAPRPPGMHHKTRTAWLSLPPPKCGLASLFSISGIQYAAQASTSLERRCISVNNAAVKPQREIKFGQMRLMESRLSLFAGLLCALLWGPAARDTTASSHLCEPLFPAKILYNRIPKSGSTSVRFLLEDLQFK